jgi:hypothetical protein
VGRLFQLFRPINEEIEEFGLFNPKEITDLTFKHRHRQTPRTLVERRETSEWARIWPEWIYLLRAKRFKPVTIVIALVSAVIAASVAKIFTAVELDKMRAKQQKADAVAKLGLIASKEISNSQVELIRLTAEVKNSLDAAWGSIDTIHHEVLNNHHYVTVPTVVLILFVGGTILVIIGVMIARRSKDARQTYQMMAYMHKRPNVFEKTLDYLEEKEAKMNPERPLKATAPQPPGDRVTAGPPPYAGQGRGRPPVSSGPGCPLGATSSLIAEMQEHARTTTGHSLGMNETELHGAGARALGAFDLGRNQEAARNYPRAPAAINMQEMMERK